MVRSSWVNEQAYDNNLPSLESMNLRDFCHLFRISQRGTLRNKICNHRKENFITIFYPSRGCLLPDSKSYHEYCKYSLLKFKPWTGVKEP